jgi:hypothetical protein
MGLKMEHGRETQDPHEPDNLFIYKQLKLIQFWYNPLRMSLCRTIPLDDEPVLRGIFHLTPIGRVLARKKRAQGWHIHIPKHLALLIRLQVLWGFPEAYGKATVGIVRILGEPAPPQAFDLFAGERLFIHPLELVPGAGIELAPGDAHYHGVLPPAMCGCADVHRRL